MKLSFRTRSLLEVRKDSLVPGVIYGKSIKATPIEISEKEFAEALDKYGKSKTFQVTLDKEKHTVYIKNYQTHHINKNQILSFDLHCLQKDEVMSSQIPVILTGKDEIESNHLFAQTMLNKIECEYAVGVNISEFVFDVSKMKANQGLYVKDIKVVKGVKILEDPETLIFMIKHSSNTIIIEPKEETVSTESDEEATEEE